MIKIKASEITPEHLYRSRRRFMVGVGALAASVALSACGAEDATPSPTTNAAASGEGTSAVTPASIGATATQEPVPPTASIQSDELGDALTDYESVIGYNNYYEFTTKKEGAAKLSQNFQSSPWTVEVGGLVNKPGVYDIDDLRKKFTRQERIYRLRCVEAWSMIIPWTGFPLAELLKEVEPTSKAKYLRFETLYDPDSMPGLKNNSYQWPYIEGLRVDEAMNNLTLLATGLYGKDLLPQNGAPVRLVVPWKYGFKSIKSIVKIDLVEEMPVSLWMAAAPHEYGFYANVNPQVDHPRWSQGSERRIGELGRRKTLMFNGYAEEVASLYDGMDLTEYF
ncbi:MAG TPA: protein-methionine-sulfoxide reductase catalytic subunit MsrP [Chloroflexi bacterium]|nr:protein-methionine-sulfoxide reductase catalytic subunit MsrP [Chloroflexota bacterium]